MKAFLLAAGKGTRLRPYTDTCPKCLMDINGKPVLEIWLENLEKAGILEVLINTHYLNKKVEEFINDYQKKCSINIKLYYEKKLLGSAGTIKANKDFIENDKDFLIIYADNLSNINLKELINFHENNAKKEDFMLTMALFRTSRPNECGIADLDKNGKIISFIEKPDEPKSDLANAGIYVCNKKIFEILDKNDNSFLDIGFDLLPLLKNRMLGFELSCFIKDIGSVKNYKESLIKWKEIEN